jgi:hypothetical protein
VSVRVLAPFCTATAKATGMRCRRRCWTGVCQVHGGAAPQVRKRGPVNKALAEAQAEAAVNGTTERRDPFEILAGNLHELDLVTRSLGRDHPAYVEMLLKTLAAARAVCDSRNYQEWLRAQSVPLAEQLAAQAGDAAGEALDWVLRKALEAATPAERTAKGDFTEYGRAMIAYRDELTAWSVRMLCAWFADEVPSAPVPPSPPERVSEPAPGADRGRGDVRASPPPVPVPSTSVGTSDPADNTDEADIVDAELLDEGDGEANTQPPPRRDTYTGGTSPVVVAIAAAREPWR